MALSEEVVDEYKTSLADLNFNSKPLINMLTMLADDHEQHASEIVKVIEDHIAKCKPEKKLPVLYLIDSIMKNLEKSSYRSMFSRNIVQTFTSVFEQVDEKTRASMFKLRQTWSTILPNASLYRIDKKIKSLLDPAWPITAKEPEQTSIHVNPRFIHGQMGSESERSSASPEIPEDPIEDSEDQEILIRQQLIEKQKELLNLKKARLELELVETAEKLSRKHGSKKLPTSVSPADLPMPSIEDSLPLPEVQKPRDPRPRPTDPRRRDPRLKNQPKSSPSSVPRIETSHTVIHPSSHSAFPPVQSQGPYPGQMSMQNAPYGDPGQNVGIVHPYNGPHAQSIPIAGIPPQITGQVFSGEVFPAVEAKFSDDDSDSSRSSFQGQHAAPVSVQQNVRDPRRRTDIDRINKGPRSDYRSGPHERQKNNDRHVNKHSNEKRGQADRYSHRDPRDPRHSGSRESVTTEKRKSKDREMQVYSKQSKETLPDSPCKGASGHQSSKHRSVSKERESKSEMKLKDTFGQEKKKKEEENKLTETKIGQKSDEKRVEKSKGRTSRERSPQQSQKHSPKSKVSGDRKIEKKNDDRTGKKPEPKKSETVQKGSHKDKSNTKGNSSQVKQKNSKTDLRVMPVIKTEPMEVDQRMKPGKEAEKRLSSDRETPERFSKKPKLEERLPEAGDESKDKRVKIERKIKEEPEESSWKPSSVQEAVSHHRVADRNIKEEDMDIDSDQEHVQKVPKINEDISDLFGEEDEDYRPVVPKPQLPLESPSSKGWDKFKATRPEYALDIQLKKHRQDSVIENAASFRLSEEPQDEDLRVPPSEFERRMSGSELDYQTSNSVVKDVNIPKELDMNLHTEILLEASKKLKDGLLTNEEHQEVMKKLHALMQIQTSNSEVKDVNSPKELDMNLHTEILLEASKKRKDGLLTNDEYQEVIKTLHALMQIQKLQEENRRHSSEFTDHHPPSEEDFSADKAPRTSPLRQPEQPIVPEVNLTRESRSPERPLDAFKIPKKSSVDRTESDRRKELSNLYPESPVEERYTAHGPFLGKDNLRRPGLEDQPRRKGVEKRTEPFEGQSWSENKESWRPDRKFRPSPDMSAGPERLDGPPERGPRGMPPERFDGHPEHRGLRANDGPPERFDGPTEHKGPRGNAGALERFDGSSELRSPRESGPLEMFDGPLEHRGPIGSAGPPERFDGPSEHRGPRDGGLPERYNGPPIRGSGPLGRFDGPLDRGPGMGGRPPERFDYPAEHRSPRDVGMRSPPRGSFNDRMMRRQEGPPENMDNRMPRRDVPPEDFNARRTLLDGPPIDRDRWPLDGKQRGPPERFEEEPDQREQYRDRRPDNWRPDADIPFENRGKRMPDFDRRSRNDIERRERNIESRDMLRSPPDTYRGGDERNQDRGNWRDRRDNWRDQEESNFDGRGHHDKFRDSRGPPGQPRNGRNFDQRPFNDTDNVPPFSKGGPGDPNERDNTGRPRDRRNGPPEDSRGQWRGDGPENMEEDIQEPLRKSNKLKGPFGRPGPPSDGSKPWLPPGQRDDSPRKEPWRGPGDNMGNDRPGQNRRGNKGEWQEEEYEPGFEQPRPKLMSILDPLPEQPPPGLRGKIVDGKLQVPGPRGRQRFDGSSGHGGPNQVDSYVDKFGDPRFRCFGDMGPEVSEEVVIGKRNFEIKLGAPPRKIPWGKDVIEVFADPSKRGVVIDQNLVYKFGERVKDVTIRGRKEKLFYHGRPLNFWIDGQSYEVRLDAPPKSIAIDSKVHKIQIDGRDMMILIDKEEKGKFGGEPRFVYVDEERKEIRFDPPPRHILIDNNPCELKLNMQQPCVNIKGVFHGIRFDGPPRDVFINGKLYQIHTDHAVKIRVGHRFHYVALGGPCHELIVDGKWFEVKFNESPKEVTVGNQVLMVRIPGNPPDVKILPEISPAQQPMQPGVAGPVRPPGIGPGLRPMGFPGQRGPPNMGPGMPMPPGPQGMVPIPPPGGPMQPGGPMPPGGPIQLGGPMPSGGPMLPGGPIPLRGQMLSGGQMLPPGGQMLPQSVPMSGPPMSIPHTAAPPIPMSAQGMVPCSGPPMPIMAGAPGPQPGGMPNILSNLFPTMPPSSGNAGPIDVISLFDKLVNTGIIKQETKPESKPDIVKTEATKPLEYIIPLKKKEEEKVEDIPDMTEMDPVEMKSLPLGMVQRLYCGSQCTSCGERFIMKDGEKTERYRQHLDWHFRQNRKGKTDMKLATFRKWYYPLQDWLQYEEVADSKDSEKSNFFEQQQQQPQEETTTPAKNPLSLVVPEGVSAIKCPPATGNDNEDVCNICHDVFEQYWDEELEEWHLRDAIKVNNKTYHPICFEDHTDVSEGTPSPSVLSVTEPSFTSRKSLVYDEASQEGHHASFEEERKISTTPVEHMDTVASESDSVKQSIKTELSDESELVENVKVKQEPTEPDTSLSQEQMETVTQSMDSVSDTLPVKQEPLESSENIPQDKIENLPECESTSPLITDIVIKTEPSEATAESESVSNSAIETEKEESTPMDSSETVIQETTVSVKSEPVTSSESAINEPDTDTQSNVVETTEHIKEEVNENVEVPMVTEPEHENEQFKTNTELSTSGIDISSSSSSSQLGAPECLEVTEAQRSPSYSRLSNINLVIPTQPPDITPEVYEIGSNASTPTQDELPSPPECS